MDRTRTVAVCGRSSALPRSAFADGRTLVPNPVLRGHRAGQGANCGDERPSPRKRRTCSLGPSPPRLIRGPFSYSAASRTPATGTSRETRPTTAGASPRAPAAAGLTLRHEARAAQLRPSPRRAVRERIGEQAGGTRRVTAGGPGQPRLAGGITRGMGHRLLSCAAVARVSADLGEVLNTVINEHAAIGHSSELAWALWG